MSVNAEFVCGPNMSHISDDTDESIGSYSRDDDDGSDEEILNMASIAIVPQSEFGSQMTKPCLHAGCMLFAKFLAFMLIFVVIFLWIGYDVYKSPIEQTYREAMATDKNSDKMLKIYLNNTGLTIADPSFYDRIDLNISDDIVARVLFEEIISISARFYFIPPELQNVTYVTNLIIQKDYNTVRNLELKSKNQSDLQNYMEYAIRQDWLNRLHHLQKYLIPASIFTTMIMLIVLAFLMDFLRNHFCIETS